jgi:hypothetical protein
VDGVTAHCRSVTELDLPAQGDGGKALGLSCG